MLSKALHFLLVCLRLSQLSYSASFFLILQHIVKYCVIKVGYRSHFNQFDTGVLVLVSDGNDYLLSAIPENVIPAVTVMHLQVVWKKENAKQSTSKPTGNKNVFSGHDASKWQIKYVESMTLSNKGSTSLSLAAGAMLTLAAAVARHSTFRLLNTIHFLAFRCTSCWLGVSSG